MGNGTFVRRVLNLTSAGSMLPTQGHSEAKSDLDSNIDTVALLSDGDYTFRLVAYMI